jgi:hypothetical protein
VLLLNRPRSAAMICRRGWPLTVCRESPRIFELGDGMRVVTFGEVMLRLAPEGFVRLAQAVPGRLEATFGGGELNVAVSIALQGGRSAFLTAVPDNVVTDALVQEMRKVGVESDLVMRRPQGRFGIYRLPAARRVTSTGPSRSAMRTGFTSRASRQPSARAQPRRRSRPCKRPRSWGFPSPAI